MMRCVWLVSLVVSLVAPAQSPPASAGTASGAIAFYAVSYVEVEATNAARAAAVMAFQSYQAGSRSQDGFIRFEAFEQQGRPGHFVFLETWRDQMVFDGRDQAPMRQLTDALKAIRISDIDRRPYKTMTVATAAAATSGTVFVITHVDASPTPQLPGLLQRLADDSRRDPGNLRFDIVQHTMRANHFTIVEAWKDRKSFDDHAASAHMRQYREAYGPMAGSPLDERVYTAVAP
jgi:quinol monooxygenase YgiN